MGNKKKKNSLFILLILVLFISVGYALLSTTLNINGTTKVKNATWNIYWDNPQVTTGSVTTTKPTIDSAKTTASFNVELDKPGDFYEFTIDAKNDGTIDGMISSISYKLNDTEVSSENSLPAYLNYTVTYSDKVALARNQLLAANSKETYKVRVEFKRDIENDQLPGSEVIVKLDFSITYVQKDNTAVIRPLAIGSVVNYSTILNGITLNEWRVFYTDDNYTYLIYDKYLPNDAIDTNVISGLVKSNTYAIYSNVDRATLINAMTTRSYWDDLINNGQANGVALSSDIKNDTNTWAMGSPDLELWVNSWNESYPDDTLYIARTESAMEDGLYGYYVGKEENPNTSSCDLSATAGYSDSLYMPNNLLPYPDIYIAGYWLATPGTDLSFDPGGSYPDYESVFNSYLNMANYSWPTNRYTKSRAFRPVIHIPTSVFK